MSGGGLFTGEEAPELPAKRLEVAVPAGLESKGDLLEHLRRELRFPDWFGGNWDALEECLRDLGWLDYEAVVLRHADLPPTGDERGRGIYVDILRSSAAARGGTPGPSLFALFPRDTAPQGGC